MGPDRTVAGTMLALFNLFWGDLTKKKGQKAPFFTQSVNLSARWW
jgi:hypothetical protein